MHPATALERLGGVGSTKDLLALSTRRRLRSAVASGRVVRLVRGRYALPAVHEGISAAASLSGVASHLSAAAHWGWPVKTPPTQPSVTVPRKRRVDPRRRQGVTVRWRDLPGDSCDGHVTTRVQTVLDCARDLPFDEALAVADSALRDRYVDRAMLLGATDELPVRVRRRVRRVIEAADSLADNPFESVLRAFALEAGLDVSPQLAVQAGTSTFYPDLVDTGRRCVLEAESFAHHGHRKALRKDCRRYTLLAVHGWRVIRFSWEDVMHDPTYVRACLQQLARDGRTDRRCPA